VGTYTNTQKLYKVAPDEIVEVESNLNYNWTRLDRRVKNLVEWNIDEDASLIQTYPQENGFKYFKRYSNSLWYSWANATTGVQEFFQDAGSNVGNWTLMPDLTSPWTNVIDHKLMYRLTSAGTVQLRGRLRYGAYTEIPLNTTFDLGTLPTSIRPTSSTGRYFFKNNGDGDDIAFSQCRLLFGSNGGFQVVRYNGVQSTVPVTERYIDFNGIEYPITTA